MSKNPESFVSLYNDSNADKNTKVNESVKKISEDLIGKEVNLYYKDQNIRVTLESVDNKYGHATVIVKKKTVLKDGRIWKRHDTVIVANEEITMNPIKKAKRVKITEPAEKPGWTRDRK